MLSKIVAVAALAAVGLLSVGTAGAQTVNPSISAGLGQNGQPKLNANVLDRLCDVRTGRNCVRKPASEQRTAAGSTRPSQQGGGPRPGKRR